MSHDSSLEPILRGVEPAARLVPERHLRAVLHYLVDRGAALPANPHLPFWVSRADLIAADVLPSRVLEGTEPVLLLITDPNDRMIDDRTQAEQLRVYWGVLFEAAMMQAIDRKLVSGELTPELCKRRLNQFGAAAGREIRYVLESEHLVAPEATDAALYRAFTVVYLSMATFRPHRLEDLFPSLPHGDAVRCALAEDLDAPALLARTKLPHALEPPHYPPPDERWEAEDTLHPPSLQRVENPQMVLGEAAEAEQKGNNVRAAILRTRIVTAVETPAEQKGTALAGAHAAIGKLVEALGEMFAWDQDTREEWRQALKPLVEAAGLGVWPRAARCLYELQKLPADLSREVFAVDLAESLRTFGRRPVKRPLPRAKPVLTLMGLRRAHTQLLRTHLGHSAHLRLDRLFQHQIDHLERGLRQEFTPIIAAELTRAGLIATNTVEEVARDKLIAELIDRVCARGYLRIGDLRDAIARNRLKMPDLSGPGEFFAGDPLLKADINLAYALDGVYRKGEFYLRWLQRASSVFFATKLGRACFLFLLLPFAGGFMAVVGAQEMSHIGSNLYGYIAKQFPGKKSVPAPTPEAAQALGPPAEEMLPPDGRATLDEVKIDEETGDYIWEDAPHPVILVREVLSPAPTTLSTEPGHGQFSVPWGWVCGLSVFLFLLIHVPPFRSSVLHAARYCWWAVRGVLWDLPNRMWRSSVVRHIRLSLPVRLLTRYLWSPFLLTALLLGLMFLFGAAPWLLARWGWVMWAALTLAYNTPWGWVVQDRVAEAISDWWRVVRVNLLPGLIATIMDWFGRLGNWVERKLYAVDERLRFRGGDSQGSFVVKSLLGLAWFPLAYVFRFAFYLLLEPQINPVKHFPVVTVSHKLLLPLVPSFGDVLARMTGWGVAKANGAAFSLIACVPGVFGFIAWELLANWRLYAANRPRKLQPVLLGSHGETMRGLLRPGFHSGTIPKLFRKLRHHTHDHGTHLHHELDHSVEGLHRFVERELVHLLSVLPEWNGVPLELGRVTLGCQRVVMELQAASLGPDRFVLGFENVGGVIEASVVQIGWVDKLTQQQRKQFVAALRGILDMGAADRVDGHSRCDDLTSVKDFADLVRRVSWAEWTERWNVPGKAPSSAGIPEKA